MSLLDGTRDLDALSAEMIAFTESHVANSQEGDPIEEGTLEANIKRASKIISWPSCARECS